jgi:Mn-dependent DtxR family transcriptional regulator
MDRLHRRGLISNPVSKAKSVKLTETGLRRAEAAYRRLVEADD